MSDGSPKFLGIDQEPDHEIVYRRHFGKAHRAPYEPLDPGLQTEALTLDSLGILLANVMLLVGAPPIGTKSCDAKRF